MTGATEIVLLLADLEKAGVTTYFEMRSRLINAFDIPPGRAGEEVMQWLRRNNKHRVKDIRKAQKFW